MKIIIIALLFYLYSKCICNNSEFSEYCNKKGIYNQDTHKCKCIENYISLEEENMECIYQKKSKTIAQIILRWHIQRGVIPIPKSSNEGRVKENLSVFDFEISSDDINIINSLNEGDNISVSGVPENTTYLKFC